MKPYIDETADVADCELADDAKIWKNVHLRSCKVESHVNIGDFSRIENSIFHEHVDVYRNAMIYNSEMERYTFCSKNFVSWHAQIGAFCSLSWNVSIGGANHDYNRLTTHPFLYASQFGLNGEHAGYERFNEDCIIGNDVWLGSGVVVLRGVHIGNGAVVGANAVVTKDVEPYTIVAGVPAKPIKKRFPDSVISELQNLEWWNLPAEIIRKNYELFNQTPNSEMIDKLKKIVRENMQR